MRKSLNDFMIVGDGGDNLNVSELMRLSDDEFLQVHIEDAKTYFENHHRDLICSECHHAISHPEDLVRYFGENLHGKCFISVYRREKEGLHKEPGVYFDRIYQIKLKSIPEM